MSESIVNALNDCQDQLEAVSNELSMYAETKKLADKLDRFIRELEAIIDTIEYDSDDY